MATVLDCAFPGYFFLSRGVKLIYGTAGDNNMFILEASSGRELARNSRDGSGAYGVVKPYLADICLVTDNLRGYRDKHNDSSIKDAVTAWRGAKELWSAELPPDADLIVAGDKILALTKTKDGIFIEDIDVPKTHYSGGADNVARSPAR